MHSFTVKDVQRNYNCLIETIPLITRTTTTNNNLFKIHTKFALSNVASVSKFNIYMRCSVVFYWITAFTEHHQFISIHVIWFGINQLCAFNYTPKWRNQKYFQIMFWCICYFYHICYENYIIITIVFQNEELFRPLDKITLIEGRE